MEVNYFAWSFLLLVNIRISILVLQLLNINTVGDFFKANAMALKSDVSCGLGDVL